MTKNILAIILITLTLALTDPIDLIMPTPIQMTLMAIIALTFIAFAGLIYREKPKDEREAFLLNYSSRSAFLVGSSLLIIAIFTQLYSHSLDNWLVWILSAMILTKIIKNN